MRTLLGIGFLVAVWKVSAGVAPSHPTQVRSAPTKNISAMDGILHLTLAAERPV